MATFLSPVVLRGSVVRGFQRGSKTLGFPTANLDPISFQNSSLQPGIYVGWASVEGIIAKAMISVGWNPFFQNKEKTVEAWIDYTFENDFYGKEMCLVVCGYIREEKNFETVEDLIAEIRNDIRIGREVLDKEPFISAKCKITSAL